MSSIFESASLGLEDCTKIERPDGVPHRYNTTEPMAFVTGRVTAVDRNINVSPVGTLEYGIFVGIRLVVGFYLQIPFRQVQIRLTV